MGHNVKKKETAFHLLEKEKLTNMSDLQRWKTVFVSFTIVVADLFKIALWLKVAVLRDKNQWYWLRLKVNLDGKSQVNMIDPVELMEWEEPTYEELKSSFEPRG